MKYLDAINRERITLGLEPYPNYKECEVDTSESIWGIGYFARQCHLRSTARDFMGMIFQSTRCTCGPGSERFLIAVILATGVGAGTRGLMSLF